MRRIRINPFGSRPRISSIPSTPGCVDHSIINAISPPQGHIEKLTLPPPHPMSDEPNLSTRPTQAEMFMEMAEAAAKRSTCGRLHVGCIITNMDMTMAPGLGYNGNARGFPNTCDSRVPGQCGCIHAEVNALIKVPYGMPLIMFTTHSPCSPCAKLIVNSSIKKVIYKHAYRSPLGIQLLETAGITVEQLR